LIFDVDGTLTDSAGLTRVALERAAREIYAIDNATRGITAYGQTDVNIFSEILVNNRLAVEDFEDHFTRFTGRYVTLLEEILFASPRPRLQPGVKDLLLRLVRESGMNMVLGTGNIEPGARLKLKRHGIDHYFPTGGFGSDSGVRADLIRIAYERGCRHFGIPFPLKDVWVIGDTPNDVAAGRALGSKILAVATGMYARAELETCQPDALMDDFSDNDRFIDVIRNG